MSRNRKKNILEKLSYQKISFKKSPNRSLHENVNVLNQMTCTRRPTVFVILRDRDNNSKIGMNTTANNYIVLLEKLHSMFLINHLYTLNGMLRHSFGTLEGPNLL